MTKLSPPKEQCSKISTCWTMPFRSPNQCRASTEVLHVHYHTKLLVSFLNFVVVAAPTIRNSLLLAIRSSVSTHSFRRQLKTLSLLNAPPQTVSQIRRASCRHCALYKFTYLLITAYLSAVDHYTHGYSGIL